MLTSYSPGESALMVNSPPALVVAVRPIPVALLVAMIAAPVTAAPEGSVTSPLRTAEPRSWASMLAAQKPTARHMIAQGVFTLQPQIGLNYMPRAEHSYPLHGHPKIEGRWKESIGTQLRRQ